VPCRQAGLKLEALSLGRNLDKVRGIIRRQQTEPDSPLTLRDSLDEFVLFPTVQLQEEIIRLVARKSLKGLQPFSFRELWPFSEQWMDS